jgi:hypothetical protein
MADEKTEWPSAERQLAEAGVASGTALEKLILDNQDFHLLDPREAHDEYDIPLWLRVHFRKNHPEVQLSNVNPGASYPEALERVYKWMLAHPDLPARSPDDPNVTKGGVR